MIGLTAYPFTVSYRGTTEDTAALVGLVQTNAHIETISYVGDIDPVKLEYFAEINLWLKQKGAPAISIGRKPAQNEKVIYLRLLLKEWLWREEECTAVLRLAGLPTLP